MKLAMINDCSFVGETIMKYLPADIEKQHIKRSRGLWSKTFGLTYNIYRAKADIYHVHYLLQDCYIAGKLGKAPLLGHAHGSDIRSSLKHRLWGNIVRYNLKVCDKILVSTPDILEIARQYREDAEYLPNPFDRSLFYPKPLIEDKGRIKVLIASDSNWAVKGTNLAIRALSRIKEHIDVSIIAYGRDFDRTLELSSSLGLKLNILPKAKHEELNNYYWNADVVIDRFIMGSLGMVSLEAIACGRPVIAYVSSKYSEYKDFPLKDINQEDEIAEAVLSSDVKMWEKQYAYLEKNHDPQDIAKRTLSIYERLTG